MVGQANTKDNAFFNLSASKLAEILGTAMNMEGLKPEQKLYAQAMLMVTASNSIGVMAEGASAAGTIPARKFSPAYSMARVGPDERALYDLIDKGEVQSVKNVVRPQVVTLTAHPNFSRSRELVKACSDLTQVLGEADQATWRHIQTHNAMSKELFDKVNPLLATMKEHLKPRTKRNREDELRETTTDMIPTVMQAATEQVQLFKQRKHWVGNTGKQGVEFSDVKQLDALAQLMPTYNSWFTDGDGKPICHIYDAELAVPAIKKATYEHYLSLLNTLSAQGGLEGFALDEWKARLEEQVRVLGEVEALAATRMHALNAMHEAKDKVDSAGDSISDADAKLQQAKEACKKASDAYKSKITTALNDRNGKAFYVKDLLQEDIACDLKTQLGEALQKSYQTIGPKKMGQQETAEDLYVKLTAFGNYAIHLQRRENAVKYKQMFSYLLEKNEDIRKVMSTKLGVEKEQISSIIGNDPNFYTKVVEKFAQLITSSGGKYLREQVRDTYLQIANKLETIKRNGTSNSVHILPTPLEEPEMRVLDGLGYMNMAKLYPELFNGGFVIAEFGQPDNDTVDKKTHKEVEQEVSRLAKTEMLIHIAFAEAMGAGAMPIIPLHEDPVTMEHIPAAQKALREPMMQQYLLKYLGLDEADAAQKAASMARQYIDENGEVKPLTAYHSLVSMGCTDQELRDKGLDIEALKHTLVLEGPCDMEACSDNSKRASIIGATVAEDSVRQKAIEVAKHPVVIGEQNYIITKPKYFGQGGAVARATEVPMDSVQATWQGEHAMGFSPRMLAQKMYNYLLARLLKTQEATRGEAPSERLSSIAADQMGHVGNRLGLLRPELDKEQRAMMTSAISARVESTRKDPRYDKFIRKYKEPVPNYSARPDVKGTKPEGFDNIRAIGLAGKEAGIFANVIGIAAMFDFEKDEVGVGKVTQASVQRVKGWYEKDPSIQHMITGAALIMNMVNLEEKWQRGGITYHYDKASGNVMLTKEGKTADLKDLLAAYDDKKTEIYQVPGTQVTFDAADLVMAHLTRQYHQLEKALLAVTKKESLLEIFPESQRDDIMTYKKLSDDMLKQIRNLPTLKDGEDIPDSRRLLEGAYYLLFESGGNIYPNSALREQEMHGRAA